MAYKHFLGYEKGEDGIPKIVESEAKIVRLIYRLFMEGMMVLIYVVLFLSKKAEITLFQGFLGYGDAVCHLLKDPVLRTTGLELPVILALISQKPLKDRGGCAKGGVHFFGDGFITVVHCVKILKYINSVYPLFLFYNFSR